MAARKAKKKTTRKRTSKGRTAFARFESELPPNLKEFSRRVQRGLGKVEKQIETAQRDARRRWSTLLRDGSRELGRIEAEGEKRWREQTKKARQDTLKVLKRLERAIEAAGKPKKKTTRKKKSVRRKARA